MAHMLDDDSPLAQPIRQASRLMDGTLKLGRWMSVLPSVDRAKLLSECLFLFSEMRNLAHAKFGAQAGTIVRLVDDYEKAIRDLAGLNNGTLFRNNLDGEGYCEVCGAPVKRFSFGFAKMGLPEQWIVSCDTCCAPMIAAHQRLDSFDGFSTWVI